MKYLLLILYLLYILINQLKQINILFRRLDTFF